MTKRKEGAKKGRPSLYSEEMANKIANRLAEGKTLAEICRMNDTPALMTVLQWQREKPDFHSLIARAREAQTETWADQILQEALKADDSTVKTAQLRINTMQWMMARMYPKKFSERVLAEMAKIPEPVKEPEPVLDPKYLNYEERELYLQLEEAGRRRRESLLIEHEPQPQEEELEEEEEDDGTDEGAGHDQPSDPAS